jgi:hypothetical protein
VVVVAPGLPPQIPETVRPVVQAEEVQDITTAPVLLAAPEQSAKALTVELGIVFLLTQVLAVAERVL